MADTRIDIANDAQLRRTFALLEHPQRYFYRRTETLEFESKSVYQTRVRLLFELPQPEDLKAQYPPDDGVEIEATAPDERPAPANISQDEDANAEVPPDEG